MFQRKTLAIVGMLVLAILVGAKFAQVQNANADCQFQPRSLIAASPADVQKAAMDYTCIGFDSFGGTSQALLTRSITPAEVVSLFGPTDALCQDQQLALVILKGDFAGKSGPLNMASRPHFEYLGYVFDLRVGAPTRIIGSHGERFRVALNEPDLPVDAPARTSAVDSGVASAPALPSSKQLRPCDYDSVAPTVMPPQ
jgi:hypothetical protein